MSAKLTNYLNKIDSFFGINNVITKKITKKNIQQYFTESSLGYTMFHSKKGSVHFAISDDGIFRKSDYNKQVKLISEILTKNESKLNILEIGSGKGYNTGNLAKSYPESNFYGLELTPSFLKQAKQSYKNCNNAMFIQGDFHKIPFENNTFDYVFEIEAMCYANNMETVIKEIHRVLRPNGVFVSFDGFRNNNFESFSNELKTACKLVEISMAVESGFEIGKWISISQSVGLSTIECKDISKQIMPNLQRFESMANKFLDSRFLKYLSHFLPNYFVNNVIAGLLISVTVEKKGQGYYKIISQKV